MNTLSEFFLEYKTVVVILHALSAALGLGAATMSDYLFFQLLKDGKIDARESKLLARFTKVVWIALGLIVLTGLGLFLSNIHGYLVSSKFLVKMFIIMILILNGLLITLYMHKNMRFISFLNRKHRIVKRIGFASGSISVISWYTVFILGSVRSIPLETKSGISVYLLMLLGGILMSQLLYFRYRRRYQ